MVSGNAPADVYQDRCGYGGRLPMAIINYVDHQLTDQTSILRFIEDNWQLGHVKRSIIRRKSRFNPGHVQHRYYYAEKPFLKLDNGTAF